MIKVKIIALGKLKEEYLKKAFLEYQKRLSRFCTLEIVELSPVYLPDSPSESEIETALKKEAEMIKSKIPDNYYVFSLCIEGNMVTSEKFASLINDNKSQGKNLCFIIGSSYGLDNSIKSLSDFKLSFSHMTFPHQFFRIMLLEQIYRGFMINEGSAYHK